MSVPRCDWVETTDPSTGRKYYGNLKTKQVCVREMKILTQSAWDPPEEWIEYQAALQAAKQAETVEENWVEYVDNNTQRPYYYNPSTKV